MMVGNDDVVFPVYVCVYVLCVSRFLGHALIIGAVGVEKEEKEEEKGKRGRLERGENKRKRKGGFRGRGRIKGRRGLGE